MIAPHIVSHVQPTGYDFSDRTGPDIIDRVPMTADVEMPPLRLQLPLRRRTEPWPVVEMPEREPVEDAPAWKFALGIVILSLALAGGLVAAVAQPEPPAPVSCVMTLDGQTTCGTPTEV